MRKKALKYLFISSLIIGAFLLGKNIDNKEIKVIDVFTKSKENFYLNEGEKGILLSDGSCATINHKEKLYTFQPATMGDWDYSFDNVGDLKKAISTYMEINNNY